MLKLHNLLLYVKSIDFHKKWKILPLNKGRYLISLDHKKYYTTITDLDYCPIKLAIEAFNTSKYYLHSITEEKDFHRLLQNNIRFGETDSFIVDMQGINSLLYARSMVFHDDVIRTILIALKYIQPKIKYLRLGASGSRSKNFHPGGEVLEYSLINGKDGSGISQTQSGYLPKNSLFSKKTLLNALDNKTLREERTIYSHSTWLKPIVKSSDNNFCFCIDTKVNKLDIIKLINFIAKKKRIEAFSIQIVISPKKDSKTLPIIVGRVLKHLPYAPIKTIQEAGEIASEQAFHLYPGQSAIFFGTNYHRIEKDWEDFRHGKPYEPQGHIHGMIVSKTQRKNQHNVFHLRNLYLFPNNICQVIITPIKKIINIEPVIVKNSEIISKTNLKIIASNHHA